MELLLSIIGSVCIGYGAIALAVYYVLWCGDASKREGWRFKDRIMLALKWPCAFFEL